jgi:serine protease DegS
VTGRSIINFLLKSIILGVAVAALLLVFIPELRNGKGLAQGFFNTHSVSASRESYFTALSRSAPAVVNIYSVSI